MWAGRNRPCLSGGRQYPGGYGPLRHAAAGRPSAAPAVRGTGRHERGTGRRERGVDSGVDRQGGQWTLGMDTGHAGLWNGQAGLRDGYLLDGQAGVRGE